MKCSTPIEMKELRPNHTSELVPFSRDSQENLERVNCHSTAEQLLSFGKICGRGKWAYIARGPSLELVNVNDGLRRAAWNFDMHFKDARITCICECTVQRTTRLLVGLQHEGPGVQGALCIFDTALSRVIKSVYVPEVVTSIEVVKNSPEMKGALSSNQPRFVG